MTPYALNKMRRVTHFRAKIIGKQAVRMMKIKIYLEKLIVLTNSFSKFSTTNQIHIIRNIEISATVLILPVLDILYYTITVRMSMRLYKNTPFEVICI